MVKTLISVLDGPSVDDSKFFTPDNFKTALSEVSRDPLLLQFVDNIWPNYNLSDAKDRLSLIKRVKDTIHTFCLYDGGFLRADYFVSVLMGQRNTELLGQSIKDNYKPIGATQKPL
jgi:hypothetical protein